MKIILSEPISISNKKQWKTIFRQSFHPLTSVSSDHDTNDPSYSGREDLAGGDPLPQIGPACFQARGELVACFTDQVWQSVVKVWLADSAGASAAGPGPQHVEKLKVFLRQWSLGENVWQVVESEVGWVLLKVLAVPSTCQPSQRIGELRVVVFVRWGDVKWSEDGRKNQKCGGVGAKTVLSFL